MKTFLGAVCVLVSVFGALSSANAGSSYKTQSYNTYQTEYTADGYGETSQYSDQYPISEAEAAAIAQSTEPYAKVLKVKLLQSGVYAVTLKDRGNVSRVMVDATTGEIL